MRTAPWILALTWFLSTLAQAENAILVFDASGSMWGQIEGRAKIEIAREVVADVLGKVPAERSLGLVAYGHRREGDCADIEEIVPVGGDRAAILAKVNALKPRGKTPLSDAVRFAAERLRYTDEPATVILVSDGAESCNADPCALGRALEAAGAGFTAHVIGFGLASATEAAGLRCLAEATGGRYIGADNAEQLASALGETVAAPPPPPPAAAPTTGHVILRATELAGGPEVQEGLEWRVASPGAEPVFHATDAGVAEADIPPGRYLANAIRARDGLKGSAEFAIEAGGARTVTIALEFEVSATLTPTPTAEAPAGSTLTVGWTGPDREGDFITAVPPDAEPTAYNGYAYTRDGNPATLRLPVEPGDYEVRYVLGAPQRVLARTAFKVLAAEATLDAPAAVSAGAPFTVGWSGPNAANDWVTVIGPDAGPQDYGSYVDADKPSPASLNAPLTPGTYELRYVAAGRKILARRAIEVTAVVASIDGPASVAAGAPFEIRWQGPNNSGDWLTIIGPDAGASAYASYVDADQGSPSTLNAPIAPGSYELRYVQKGTTVLARRPIEVNAVSATLEAPDSVTAGTAFEIRWQGPNNNGDWLTIIGPDAGASAYGSYVDADRGSPSTLNAPATPGDYELRYVQKGISVLARRPIRVTAP